MQIYQAVYLPTLTYGSETWARTEKIDSQISSAEMKYLRRSINKTKKDKVRNTKIREETNRRPITEIMEEKQMKWYGHVKRMGIERIVRKSVEAKEWGKKTRGRPRTTWLDNVERYGTKKGKTLGELNKITEDRKKWREFVEATRR